MEAEPGGTRGDGVGEGVGGGRFPRVGGTCEDSDVVYGKPEGHEPGYGLDAVAGGFEEVDRLGFSSFHEGDEVLFCVPIPEPV